MLRFLADLLSSSYRKQVGGLGLGASTSYCLQVSSGRKNPIEELQMYVLGLCGKVNSIQFLNNTEPPQF